MKNDNKIIDVNKKVNRRDFFKKTVQYVVPSLALLGLGAMTSKVSAYEGDGCQNSCTYTCTSTCTGSCSGSCNYSCTSTCTGSCSGSCTGSCENACNSSCSGGCSNGCYGSSN